MAAVVNEWILQDSIVISIPASIRLVSLDQKNIIELMSKFDYTWCHGAFINDKSALGQALKPIINHPKSMTTCISININYEMYPNYMHSLLIQVLLTVCEFHHLAI